MKKILLLLIIIIGILILIVGCTEKHFNQIMNEGKTAVERGDYETAKEKFNLATFEKRDNKEAKALLNQASNVIEGKQLESEGYFKEAKNMYDNINNIDSQYNKIKIEGKHLSLNMSKELEKEDESREFLKELKRCALDVKNLLADLEANNLNEHINKDLENIVDNIEYYNNTK